MKIKAMYAIYWRGRPARWVKLVDDGFTLVNKLEPECLLSEARIREFFKLPHDPRYVPKRIKLEAEDVVI